VGQNCGDIVAESGVARAPVIGLRVRFALASRFAPAVLGICYLALMSNAARANTVIASFQNGELQFENSGTATSTGLFSDGSSAPGGPVSATFEFHENVTGGSVHNVTYANGATISATLTFTSEVNGAATGVTNLDQPIQDGQLEFVDQYGNDLLTISNFTGDVTGRNGGSAANFDTDATVSINPDSGTYSSDFYNFAFPHDVVNSTAMTLDGGTFTSGTGGYLTNFTGNSDGSFATAVPEPSALGIMGLCSTAMLLRRRRA
jgi:hypothetical protein